jgi:hypothetical protein
VAEPEARMKKIDGTSGVRDVFFLLGMACLILVSSGGLPAMGLGFDTNAIPYSDSFESYTNGTLLIDTAPGWYSDQPDALQILTTNLVYSGQKPLSAETHTNVMKIDSAATNVFPTFYQDSSTVTGADVWVDMLLQPRQWDEDNPPAVTNDVLTAVYVTSNGNIAAYCTHTPDGLSFSNIWVVFPQIVIGSSQWVRITLAIDFDAWDPLYESGSLYDYFQIQMNNSTYLTNYFGQSNPNAWDTGGSWFMCARNNSHTFNSISLSGSGMLDDLVVATNAPVMTPPRTIRVIADTGSTITPAGPNETVEDGGNIDFSWLENTGYNLTNSAWGEGLGSEYATNFLEAGTTNHTFTNVTTDYTLRVFTETEQRSFVNTSLYGTVSPTDGNFPFNTIITGYLSGATAIPVGVGTQIAYTGWTRTVDGSPVYGSGTSTVFALQGLTTSSITTQMWNWGVQHWLNVEVSGQGLLDVGDGWYDTGAAITITATPTNGALWVGWTGDTNGATFPDTNIISVTMDQTRTIQANFVGGMTNTSHGTRCSWIQKYYGVVDFEAIDIEDTDHDGMRTWQEFIAGTDPTNSASVFVILEQGYSGSSNYLRWYGTTNSGVFLPFGMLRCTNLLQSWGTSIASISRTNAVNGTNTWWDITPPTNVPVFYRPMATNVW